MEQEKAKYYKFMNAAGVSQYADCKWNLPVDGTHGEWMPEITEPLVICEVGYHAVDRNHVLDWLHERLYEVELAGEIVQGDNKFAGQKARLLRVLPNWNESTARLFAADCAAFALKYSENHDPRFIKAIEVARLFAVGKATDTELAAASAAAWAAASHAASHAAWAVARAAAWDAAWAVAWAAARHAAWAVVSDAARFVLTLRFWEYVEPDTTPEPWPIGFDAIEHYKSQA